MDLDRYSNHEFSHYLNRHLLGIVRLKEKLKKLTLYFELTEAFSAHACRLYIDVDFIDFEKLTEEEKRQANTFFYNYSNETGSKFVSYIYKPQRSYYIDIEEIELFVRDYQLAQSLFEEVLKHIVSDQCIIEVENLASQPFFNYASDYLGQVRFKKDEENFEKEYFRLTKRKFEFDCQYHDFLVKAAEKEGSMNRETILTDKELNEAGAGEISNIREFVIEKRVSFFLGYNKDVIREIYVDIFSLKDKIRDYMPQNSYGVLNKGAILKIISQKEQVIEAKANLILKLKEELGADVGDYILIGTSGSEDIGVVKGIAVGNDNTLNIEYSVLKKDLSESKSSSKFIGRSNISYVIKSEVFNQELKSGSVKIKDQAIRLFKDRGNKNQKAKSNN